MAVLQQARGLCSPWFKAKFGGVQQLTRAKFDAVQQLTRAHQRQDVHTLHRRRHLGNIALEDGFAKPV